MKLLRGRPRYQEGQQLLYKFGGRIDLAVLVLERQGQYGAWEYRVLAGSGGDRVFRFTVSERGLRFPNLITYKEKEALQWR